MELVVGELRLPVRRDVAMEVFARATTLADAHRLETVEVAVAGDKPTVVHLLLGVQPVAVVEPDPGQQAGRTRSRGPESGVTERGTSRREAIPAESIVPDFDAYA